MADTERQILRDRKWISIARTLERGLQYGDWLIINSASLENGGAQGPGSSDSLSHNEYMKSCWVVLFRRMAFKSQGCILHGGRGQGNSYKPSCNVCNGYQEGKHL